MDVTIKDVAREANVSQSTVSRVIKDSPHISEGTKKRVREVMNRLGFYPNYQAQILAGRNTQALGIIMPSNSLNSFQNPFFLEILQGISKSANKRNYGIYLSTSNSEEAIFEEAVTMVQGKRVDGVLLLYSRVNDKLLSYLTEMNIPFTVVGRPYQKEHQITYVDNDNQQTTKDITNYLIELGHQKIAYIGGAADFVVTIDRLKGFADALNHAQIPIDENLIIEEKLLKEKEFVIIKQLMTQTNRPTAIITQDDLIAFHIIKHLKALHLEVPNDVSIVSFNNFLLAELAEPPLTSVDIGIYNLGYEATICLIDLIEKKSTLPKRITIPTNLIKRCSEKAYSINKSLN